MSDLRSVTEDDYTFMSLEEASSPCKEGFFVHHVDCWWLVHPQKGLAFFNPKHGDGGRHPRYGSPQQNKDERIARMAAHYTPFEAEVRQVRSVWVPVAVSDYAQG